MKFDHDIFLRTDYPVATGSNDHISDLDITGATRDFTDGAPFAQELLGVFPDKKTLIDLGCATGEVPLTMRAAGMLAVGLEGSDKPKRAKLGCWSQAPDIVRTCDIGKPFTIVDLSGAPVTFDFVTSWGVLEHIPEHDFRCCLENILRLMHKDSIGILNIDLGWAEAGVHMLWANHPEGGCHRGQSDHEGCDAPTRYTYLQEILPKYFTIDDALKQSREWSYCRPTAIELKALQKAGDHIHAKRSYWWIRKQQLVQE